MLPVLLVKFSPLAYIAGRPGTPLCGRPADSMCESRGGGSDTPMSTSQTNSLSSSVCDELKEPRIMGNYLEHGSDSEAVLSDVSSVPELMAHPSMSESWLMPPPPCFTASGSHSPATRQDSLKANPLENLLIEHPSMSVYDTRGRPSSTGHDSETSSTSDNTEMPKASRSGTAGRSRAVTSQSSGRSRVVTAKQQLLAQHRMRKSMQVGQKKRDHKKLATSQLQRSNKVTHAQSGRPMRRQHFMQLRNSGAVNDRKSQ